MSQQPISNIDKHVECGKYWDPCIKNSSANSRLDYTRETAWEEGQGAPSEGSLRPSCCCLNVWELRVGSGTETNVRNCKTVSGRALQVTADTHTHTHTYTLPSWVVLSSGPNEMHNLGRVRAAVAGVDTLRSSLSPSFRDGDEWAQMYCLLPRWPFYAEPSSHHSFPRWAGITVSLPMWGGTL